MKLYDNFYRDVLACLRDLADADFQERVWKRGEGPEVSSYTELVCQLYDDTALGDFLDQRGGRYVFTSEIDELLIKLRAQLQQIDGRIGARDILRDPRWLEIRPLAAKAAELIANAQTKTHDDTLRR